MSTHFHLNSDVLKAWCDAPSHFLPPEPAAAPAEHRESEELPPQRHRYSPAEISQHSVDLLLREYYAIVTSQGHNKMHKSEGGEGGVVQRAFLLLCPAPPTCLELDHVLKASTQVVTLSARLLALSACLLVPVLLGVIRQVQRDHGRSAAAAVTVGSLLLLLVADTISRRALKQQAAAQAACVTAATLHQQLSAGVTSHELATLRAASKTATTSNSSRPSLNLQQGGNAQHNQQPAAAAPAAVAASGRPGSVNGNSTVTTYAALGPDLATLQSALGVDIRSSNAAGSREHAVEVLWQLGQQLGVEVTPEMTAGPAAMAAAIASLKKDVGI